MDPPLRIVSTRNIMYTFYKYLYTMIYKKYWVISIAMHGKMEHVKWPECSRHEHTRPRPRPRPRPRAEDMCMVNEEKPCTWKGFSGLNVVHCTVCTLPNANYLKYSLVITMAEPCSHQQNHPKSQKKTSTKGINPHLSEGLSWRHFEYELRVPKGSVIYNGLERERRLKFHTDTHLRGPHMRLGDHWS